MGNPFEKLLEQLQAQTWPAIYMFKVIAPLDNAEAVYDIFKTYETESRFSKNGNYVSITVKAYILQPETVIEKYELLAKVEGVIAL